MKQSKVLFSSILVYFLGICAGFSQAVNDTFNYHKGVLDNDSNGKALESPVSKKLIASN